MDNDRQLPGLARNQADIIAASLRALLGGAPVVGPALAELFTIVIPGQQAHRFEKFLIILAHRLEGAEATIEQLKEQKSSELIELGSRLSVQQVDASKIERIASCVAKAISGLVAEPSIQKRIVEVVSQLDDIDIKLLQSLAVECVPRPSASELDGAIRLAAALRLERQGLIEFQFEKSQNYGAIIRTENGLTPFGQSTTATVGADGAPVGSYCITALGRLALASIGQ